MRKAFLIVVLTSLLWTLPTHAHTPNPADPENYIPTLGWIQEVSGDVHIVDSDGTRIAGEVGEEIVGGCVIETDSDGRVVLQLEDYADHASRLTVESDTRINIEARGGKHYDDTIGHRWFIYPHSVVADLRQGRVRFLIATLQEGTERFDLKVSTPQGEISLPYHFSMNEQGSIDFIASLKRNDNNEGLAEDMGKMTEMSFGQMAQMGGIELDEETTNQMQEMMAMYNEEMKGAVESGFAPEEHGTKTEIQVITGTVRFGDKEVVAGETLVADGVNEPMKVGDKSAPEALPVHPVSLGKPAIALNVPLEDNALRPELAKNMQTQVELAIQSEGDVPPGMLKISIWVYQVEGDPKTLLQNHKWPANTKTALENKDMEEVIFELVDNFGSALDKAWGPDWSFNAEMAAMEHSGKMITTSTYSYTVPPMESTTVNVVSPWLDPKTLEVFRGTYIMIIQTSVNLQF